MNSWHRALAADKGGAGFNLPAFSTAEGSDEEVADKGASRCCLLEPTFPWTHGSNIEKNRVSGD